MLTTSRDAFDSIVQIVIGPEEKVFNFHKKLLCDTSTYFSAALTGNFKEGQDQKIDMIEEDVEVFRHFHYWVYTGLVIPGLREPRDIAWSVLASLYIFAEARGIPKLQNTAMDLLIRKQVLVNATPRQEIHRLYEYTSEKSPVRKWLVDSVAKHGSADWLRKDQPRFPNEFFFDLAVALMQYDSWSGKVSLVSDFWEVRSKYHVAETG